MDCTVCGEPIGSADLVMATYGDSEFEAKKHDPFPLHRDCFETNRVLTVSRWVTDEDGESSLESFETTRYVEVESAHG